MKLASDMKGCPGSGRQAGSARPQPVITRAHAVLLRLVALWTACSWAVARHYHEARSAGIFQRESWTADQQARSVALDLKNSLAFLHGIPAALARDETVRARLRRFGPEVPKSAVASEVQRRAWTEDSFLAELNTFLAGAARDLVPDVIWVCNAGGECVASSNAGIPDSFVGILSAPPAIARPGLRR
jgi:C4-dicarboxylate-specific signal transduction histidine kinase